MISRERYDLCVKCRLATILDGGWQIDGSVTTTPPPGTMCLIRSFIPGGQLFVVAPTGRTWDVDQPTAFGGPVHSSRIRIGEPPNVSVVGAWNGGPGSLSDLDENENFIYHAFLWGGELVNIERARDPAQFALLDPDQQAMFAERLPLSFPPPNGAFGKRVTIVLNEPPWKASGILTATSTREIILDGTHVPKDLYVRAYVNVDWWERDVRPRM